VKSGVIDGTEIGRKLQNGGKKNLTPIYLQLIKARLIIQRVGPAKGGHWKIMMPKDKQ